MNEFNGYRPWQGWVLDHLPGYCRVLSKGDTGKIHVHGFNKVRRIFYVHSSGSCAWDLTEEQLTEICSTCETEMEVMAYLRKVDDAEVQGGGS